MPTKRPAASPGRDVVVLYLINSMGAGGAEQSLSELLPELRRHGIDVRLVTLSNSDLPGQVAPDRGDRPVECPGDGWVSRTLGLRRIIREMRPDLVHTTLFDADVVGRLAGRLTGTPVLTSLVNTTYDGSRRADPAVNPQKLRVVQGIDAVTARLLNRHLHAITHAVKESAVASLRVRPDKVTVVERGRGTGRLGEPSAERRAAVRASLGLADDDEVVLTVGRQEWQKGQEVLVQAFDDLADRRPRARLLLVGRSGHASPVIEEAVAAARNADRIERLGHRADVPDLLVAADVFAFPSRYEGLGGAVIEAMAMGLPVVASDVSALAEVVEDGGNGRLVPPDDVPRLAAALEEVLADDVRRAQLGRRSRELFQERFTLERSAERMAALYRAVVSS